MKRQRIACGKKKHDVTAAPESAAAFLRRMRSLGNIDDDAIAEVEAAVDEHRHRWRSTSVS
jgi:hypothetical protein